MTIITTREQAAKAIAEILNESRAKLEEAINIANDWEIEFSYELYNPEGGSYNNYTDWEYSDEWVDSGCTEQEDWQESDC